MMSSFERGGRLLPRVPAVPLPAQLCQQSIRLHVVYREESFAAVENADPPVLISHADNFDNVTGTEGQVLRLVLAIQIVILGFHFS
jgi:hypothetical protein